jgi:hypothetical protein
MLEKKCMRFFKYFFTLKNSGLGSGSASVFKTLDPDPQEMDGGSETLLKTKLYPVFCITTVYTK